MKAQVVKYSSVVGQSIMLLDEKGVCVAQLSINNVQTSLGGSHREASQKIAEEVAQAINEQTVRELPAAKVADTMTQQEIVKSMGFTGGFCSNCGSVHLVRTGACVTCQSCGTNTGCS